MKKNLTLALGALALGGAVASASASFMVTEIYPGISGEDGTNDWFEITNVGNDGTLNTGTLFWDDDGPNAADGGTLDSFLLADGESAVFLIGDNLTDFEDDSAENAAADLIAQFTNVWGSGINVGITNGGGNLSQNGDSVNISTDGGLTFPYTVAFGSGYANTGATIDNVSGLADSVVGTNGAYVSNSFFNDNDPFGLGGTQVTLIGSPGIVPEPASLALLAIGGLAAFRRR